MELSWGKPKVLLVASMPFPSWAVSPETTDSMGDMIYVPGQAMHVLTFGKSLVTGNKAGVLSVYPSRNAFVVATVISRCFHLRCAFPFPRREEMVLKWPVRSLSQISAVFVLYWGLVSPGWSYILYYGGFSNKTADSWYVYIQYAWLTYSLPNSTPEILNPAGISSLLHFPLLTSLPTLSCVFSHLLSLSLWSLHLLYYMTQNSFQSGGLPSIHSICPFQPPE